MGSRPSENGQKQGNNLPGVSFDIYRPLTDKTWMTALGCGFNRSIQHLLFNLKGSARSLSGRNARPSIAR